MITGVGDEVVAFNPLWFAGADGAVSSAVRDESGSWTSIPPPELNPISAALGNDGESAILAVAVCPEGCDQPGRFQFMRLESPRTRWELVGKAVEFSDPEPSVSFVGAVDGWAVFGTTGGTIAVKSDGDIKPLPAQTGVRPGTSLTCSTGSDLVTATSEIMNFDSGGISGAIEMRLADLASLNLTGSPAWKELADPPDEVSGAGAGACTSTGLLFVDSGVETTYASSTGEWTQRTLTHPDTADLSIKASPLRSALLPDGTLFVITSAGTVWRRAADGTWTDMKAPAYALVGTSSQVFGVNADDNDLTIIGEA